MAKPTYTLAQIIDRLDSGAGWAGSTITYAMPDSAFGSGVEGSGFVDMTTTMKTAAEDAFELWDDLIVPSMTRVASGGNVNMGYSTATNGSTYCASSYGAFLGDRLQISSAEIWCDNTWWTHDDNSDFYFGGYGNLTYIHEIGHSLGLDHPGPYNGSGTYASDAVYKQDTHRYTVMSYFEADADGSGTDHYDRHGDWLYPQTPMVHDVAAIQEIYGRDTATRSGNTTYGFHSTAGKDVFNFSVNTDPILTIWDGGGNDTLDLSGFSQNQIIKLAPGSYSSAGYMTNNVAIALKCYIENAIGGRGADKIYGTGLDNKLTGRAGDDTIFGGAGDDRIRGDGGDDTIYGGSGYDTACLNEARSHYSITRGSNFVQVRDISSGDVDKYIGIEKITFTDKVFIV